MPASSLILPTPPWTTGTIKIDDPMFDNMTIGKTSIAYAPMENPILLTEQVREDGRWYQCGKELYPSCTTLIKATDFEGQEALKKWRKSVGEEFATSFTAKAAKKGTKWHNFCEAYTQSQPTWAFTADPLDQRYGAAVAHTLDTRIKRIIANEMRVVSKQYGIAGRLDTCAELWDGRIAIIDYKTGGKKEKFGNRLNNYAVQATFYAKAIEECINVKPTVVVVVQLLNKEILWQESNPVMWVPILEQRIEQYADLINTSLDALG